MNDTCELRSCGVKFTHVHCRRCRKVASSSPCALCAWRGEDFKHVPNFMAQAAAADVMFTETVRALEAAGHEVIGGGRDVSFTSNGAEDASGTQPGIARQRTGAQVRLLPAPPPDEEEF